jgi:hypothetical protein
MKFIYSIFIFLILLSSCANIVAPSGGVKDINPPKVLNKKISEKQGITNISFTFDEYIQINKWEEYFYVKEEVTYLSFMETSSWTEVDGF